MPVKRDGRRVLAKVTGATSMPSQSAKRDIGTSHSSAQSALRPVGASREAQRPKLTTLRTTAVCALGLAALSACIWGGPWLADHLPNIILGLCIVILGIVFGALLAVRA